MVGLSIGMACSILILLWVVDELSYDRFHANSDRIFRVMEHQDYSDEIFTTTSTPGILAPALKEEVPEIEYATTYTWNMNYLFTKDDKSLKENGIYARPDFFHILTIGLEAGNRNELLTNPYSVVISQDLAQKYFGSENPVGQSVTINQDEVHTVTGVFRKLPDHSSLQFDYVLPFEDWLKNNEWATEWGNNGPRTIVSLHKQADAAAVSDKIKNFIKERNEGSVVEMFLYPFADLYLYGRFVDGKVTGGRIDYVRLFSVVAVFVLIIACINFMNLSTARATRRAKEVGIRKSIGAGRGSLVGQFIGESLIITFTSLLAAGLLAELFLPVFNELAGKEIAVNYTDPIYLLIFAGIALITGLVSGSYPAFYLSSFEAVKTLKGTIRSSAGEVFARKGLVVFQFALSVILIVSTIVVYNQIQYTQTKNLGYEKENLIYFPTNEGDLNNRWDAFRQELLAHPGVKQVSRSSHIFLGRNSNTSGVEWPGKDSESLVLFEAIRADYELVETLGFRMAEGRSFSREYGTDSTKVILNEAAIEVMGMEEPVGQTISFWGDDREIIGVVEDFNYQHLRNNVEPLFMILNPQNTWNGFVRLQSDDMNRTIRELESIYMQFNPDYPFDYKFMDQQYAALYKSEMRVGDLAKYFSLFAILISCLGLFGLSAFTAEQRTKEIGIRKVLGASVQNLVLLLSKDFTRLVLISIVIALPVSWWLMDQWLSDYAYRIEIRWWMFALSGAVAITIAWATVSWQSIKAALMNPVASLKSE